MRIDGWVDGFMDGKGDGDGDGGGGMRGRNEGLRVTERREPITSGEYICKIPESKGDS
jgi:hypothetical protein